MHTASCSHVPWPVLVLSSPFTQYGTVVTTGCNRMASMRRLRMFSSILKSTPTHDSLVACPTNYYTLYVQNRYESMLCFVHSDVLWYFMFIYMLIWRIWIQTRNFYSMLSSLFVSVHLCSSVRRDSGLLRVKTYPRTKSIESGTDRPPANSIVSKNTEPIKSSLWQCLKHCKKKRIHWLFSAIAFVLETTCKMSSNKPSV